MVSPFEGSSFISPQKGLKDTKFNIQKNCVLRIAKILTMALRNINVVKLNPKS